MSFRLVAHDTFIVQYDALRVSRPQIANSLDNKLRVIATDPRGGGASSLSAVSDPGLAGKLLRVWIHGNKGHRLVYLVTEVGVPDLTLVCPLVISAGGKSRFDYDKIGTDDIMPTLAAIDAEQWEEFTTLPLAGAQPATRPT